MNSTKRAIQTTFIDLYRKKSYDQMNVKELCVQTPVARTTFYEYYDNLGTLKAEIEDELIGGILKIAKATAGGSFVEMNLNVFFAQTLDYIKSHWEENYAFLVAQPNLAYIAKWKDAIKYHFRLRFPEKDAVPNHGLIMEVIASAVIGAYTYWMEHPDEVDTQKLAELFCVQARTLFENVSFHLSAVSCMMESNQRQGEMYDGRDQNSCVPHRRGMRSTGSALWRRALQHDQGIRRVCKEIGTVVAACVSLSY